MKLKICCNWSLVKVSSLFLYILYFTASSKTEVSVTRLVEVTKNNNKLNKINI